MSSVRLGVSLLILIPNKKKIYLVDFKSIKYTFTNYLKKEQVFDKLTEKKKSPKGKHVTGNLFVSCNNLTRF